MAAVYAGWAGDECHVSLFSSFFICSVAAVGAHEADFSFFPLGSSSVFSSLI